MFHTIQEFAQYNNHKLGIHTCAPQSEACVYNPRIAHHLHAIHGLFLSPAQSYSIDCTYAKGESLPHNTEPFPSRYRVNLGEWVQLKSNGKFETFCFGWYGIIKSNVITCAKSQTIVQVLQNDPAEEQKRKFRHYGLGLCSHRLSGSFSGWIDLCNFNPYFGKDHCF